MTKQEAYQALIHHGLDWYVVEHTDGRLTLQHATALSSILDCGYDPAEYGIAQLHQCWNGEELGESPW
jgi:hypothetical protein